MGRKHCGKEKLLVFKRLVLQTRNNQGLFGKELRTCGNPRLFCFKFLSWLDQWKDMYLRQCHCICVKKEGTRVNVNMESATVWMRVPECCSLCERTNKHMSEHASEHGNGRERARERERERERGAYSRKDRVVTFICGR